jgi:hypothetical protein
MKAPYHLKLHNLKLPCECINLTESPATPPEARAKEQRVRQLKDDLEAQLWGMTQYCVVHVQCIVDGRPTKMHGRSGCFCYFVDAGLRCPLSILSTCSIYVHVESCRYLLKKLCTVTVTEHPSTYGVLQVFLSYGLPEVT